MTKTTPRATSGYSTWRLIADEVRSEIIDGYLQTGAKLPTEAELAERFQVHRNTVRQAVAALVSEGLVERRQGSGTYVLPHTLLLHRVGLRTRLSESARDTTTTFNRPLSAELVTDTPAEAHDRLQLQGRPALKIETIGHTDGSAVARSTAWFNADLTPELDDHLRHTRSITKALQAIGIDDYVRTWSAVSARTATTEEAQDLNIPAGSIVLVVRSLNSLTDGRPLQYSNTRFRADQVELDIDFDAFPKR